MSDDKFMGENLAPDNEQDDKDYLSEYVGEGKQFASIEEAAKALAKKAKHADAFIETLKNEKEEEKRLTG